MTDARFAGTAAMSISPFARAATNAEASLLSSNSYLLALVPLSLSSMSLTMPMAVGPVSAPTFIVVTSSVGWGSSAVQPATTHSSMQTASRKHTNFFIFFVFLS